MTQLTKSIRHMAISSGAALVLLALLAIAAPAAQAARIDSWFSSGAYVRGAPSTGAMQYGLFGTGTPLELYCWVDGERATGNYSTDRWFGVAIPSYRYGGTGYIHASLVADQYSVPHC